MKNEVIKIWPEIEWIKDDDLREKTLNAWVWAIEHSVLSPEDLEVIPFSLLIKDVNVSFKSQEDLCPTRRGYCQANAGKFR
jgi:hypothetical protein